MKSHPHLLVVALGALVLGCGQSSSPPAVSPPELDLRPDVVLITIDTLRADHLGCYGARDVGTPAIDALAARGTLFTRATAPLPETRPSHFTLFTGQPPRVHGVVSNALALPESARTLAEVFADAGYATSAFVGCGLFTSASGAAQGFASLDVPYEPQRPAQDVVPRALEWLAAHDQGAASRPLFLWVHLFDPHMPYEAPSPSPASSGAAPLERFTWPALLDAAERHGGDLPPAWFRRARELYRAEVEHADRWTGELLDALAARPRAEQTLILLTSDHGECFGKGIFFEHSHCLDEGALAVPMILAGPGVEAGQRLTGRVEHLDVGPTLLRLAGLEIPESFTGAGLLRRSSRTASPEADEEKERRETFFEAPLYGPSELAGRREVYDTLRSVAGEAVRPPTGARRAGLYRGRWKYLRDGQRDRLFDLRKDPDAFQDLSASMPRRKDALEGILRSWLRRHPLPVSSPDEIDPQLREQLEALGYL